MKIGIVLSSVPVYSETFFRSKIKGLKEQGFEVLLFTDYTKQKSDLEYICGAKNHKSFFLFHLLSVLYVFIKLILLSLRNLISYVKLERNDNKGWTEIIKTVYFSSHILRYNPDWLHFGFVTHALDKENVAKAIGAKMAVSFRGYDINIYPMKKPGSYTHIWPKLDKVHSISDSLYQKAISLGLNRKVPYVKITPAIDVNSFNVKQRVFESGRPINILTVARLSWIKGLDYALMAMAILKQKGTVFHYSIVGRGGDYERLRFAIHQLQLEDTVSLLGEKDKSQIIELYNNSDLYIQPSINEGFCNALLEAQACRCLSIASDVGGLKENIIDGQTGWLVPPRNPDELAEKISQVNNLPEGDKLKIVDNARIRVEKEFSLELQTAKFRDFYSR